MTWPPYPASETGQMREAATPTTPTSLTIHELRPDGLPLCGPKADTWQGKTMRLVDLGPGSVTCGSCASITGR